jgi:hypothetical protein
MQPRDVRRQGSCARWTSAALATLTLGMQIGCEAPPDAAGPAETETTTSALNGSASFPGNTCGSNTSKVQGAVTVAFNNLNSPLMDDCLREAMMSYNTDIWAEQALAGLRQNFTTAVTCVSTLPPGAAGEADIGINGESIRLLTSFVSNPSVTQAQIAAVILHEVMHNRGGIHPNAGGGTDGNDVPGWSNVAATSSNDYFTSINNQVQACSFSISNGFNPAQPNFRRRSSLQGESTLGPAGGAGGGPVDIACGAGLLAKGLRHRTGVEVDAMGLWCGAPGFDPTQLSGMVGGTGGTQRDQFCFGNEVLVGIRGRAGTVHTQIGPICESESDVRAGNTTNVFFDDTAGNTTFGGTGGFAYQRQCPAFMYLRAVKARGGNRVDRTELVCQRIDRVEPVSETFLPRRGGAPGNSYQARERCPGRAVMTGLNYLGFTGGIIQRLGGTCFDISTSCSVDAGCADALGSGPHIMQSQGVPSGGVAQENCPSGQALVGLKVRTGTLVDNVQGVCASVGAWSVPSGSAPTTDLAARGGSGGGPSTLLCARGEFLIGWDIAYDIGLTYIQPICRNFR